LAIIASESIASEVIPTEAVTPEATRVSLQKADPEIIVVPKKNFVPEAFCYYFCW